MKRAIFILMMVFVFSLGISTVQAQMGSSHGGMHGGSGQQMMTGGDMKDNMAMMSNMMQDMKAMMGKSMAPEKHQQMMEMMGQMGKMMQEMAGPQAEQLQKQHEQALHEMQDKIKEMKGSGKKGS